MLPQCCRRAIANLTRVTSRSDPRVPSVTCRPRSRPCPPVDNGFVGGDRNAPTNYTFANNRVTIHWLNSSPIRVSALRSLGAMANTFANESFMDELAYAAGIDPVQFRLNHLDDPRAVAVVQTAAADIGWQPHSAPSNSGRGLGIAF